MKWILYFILRDINKSYQDLIMTNSTKNTKDNRKCVSATYLTQYIFKIPDGLDLEDKSVVKFWGVKWAKLYIVYVDGREEEIEEYMEAEPDYKHPDSVAIEDADDYNVDYEEDEEEEDVN